jgi:hypothetical protein
VASRSAVTSATRTAADRRGVASAMGVAGLPALAGVILAVALGGAGVRLARRELAGTRLILIE